jgi:hypothetical protein
MAQTKPIRIAITASPELKAALWDLGNALGQPPSTVLGNIAEEMIPQLLQLAKLTRAATLQQHAEAKAILSGMVEEGAREVTKQLIDLRGV